MNKISPDILSIVFSFKELCTRCGTCLGVCPTKAISLDALYYPKLDANHCIECGLCKETCPGAHVNFSEMQHFTFGQSKEYDNFDGYVEKTYVGYASDKTIRKRGAGGGVVTALAWHLLSSRKVDGCIVTRMQKNNPTRGQVFIARSYHDLLSSQQSKYTIIPVNSIFQLLQNMPGQYALIGLPCQIHGFRLLQQKKPALSQKIVAVIGLFCASSLEPEIADEMIKMKRITPGEVKAFHFRGGSWPGRIRVIKKDGLVRNLHYSNFKDGAINYLTYLYSPQRCQTCIDGSSEFSDISVSDAWTRGIDGKYIFESQSRILVRTENGKQIVHDAIEGGELTAQDVTDNRHYNTHKRHARKKGKTVYIRVARLRNKGAITPVYDRQYDHFTKKDRLKEILESFLMRVSRRKSVRYFLFKILTSRYGIPLVKIRQKRKSKKYRNDSLQK